MVLELPRVVSNMFCFRCLRNERTLRCGIVSIALLALSLAPRAGNAQASLTSQWGFQPTMEPSGMAYSPSGGLLAVGGPGGVTIYSTSTHLPYRGLSAGVASVKSIAFSPDGKTLAVGGAVSGSSGLLQLWTVSTGKLEANLRTAATSVNSVQFSSNGSALLAGGANINAATKVSTGVVEEWQMSTDTRSASLNTAATSVDAVAISPNGSTIVVGGATGSNGDLEVWNASTNSLFETLNLLPTQNISSVVFSTSGNVIAVGGTGSSGGALLQMWDLIDGCPQTLTNTGTGAISSVAFSPDGTELVGVGSTSSTVDGRVESAGQLQVWNLNTGTMTSSATSGWNLSSVAFSPDGSTLADLGGTQAWSGAQFETTEGFLELRSIAAGLEAATTYTERINPAPVGISTGAPAFSPDGTMVVGGVTDLNVSGSGTSQGFLNVWSTATGTVAKALPAEVALGHFVAAFSPDNKSLAVAGTGSYAASLHIWNISTGALEHSFDTGLTGDAVAYAPNGELVAVAGQSNSGEGVLQVWNLSTGKLEATFDSESNYGLNGLAFSPDSSKLADAGTIVTAGHVPAGVLELWNVTARDLISRLPTKAAIVFGVGFSPDGSTLAAGGEAEAKVGGATSGTLELWSVTTHKLVGSEPLLAGTTGVSLVSYSPSGKTLYAVSRGAADDVQAFDPVTSQRLGYYFAGYTGSFALAPANGLVATASVGLSLATMPAKY